MSISSFVTGNVIWIAVGIIIIFLIIKYLISSGYFKKIGLDFSKIDLSALQQDDDFWRTDKKEEDNKKPKDKPDDFFQTEYNVQGGVI
jgi:hypothetical protein